MLALAFQWMAVQASSERASLAISTSLITRLDLLSLRKPLMPVLLRLALETRRVSALK